VATGKLQNTPVTKKEVPPPDAPLHEQALAEKIRLLQVDRERHARAIAEIDAVLARIQQALTALHGRGSDLMSAGGYSPTASPLHEGDKPRRRYQKLPQTGEESVLAFIREHGKPTTAEINEHWKSEGRPGVANPTVARLLKRGLLTRQNDPAVRGSRYSVA
jgi:hypothetical protein